MIIVSSCLVGRKCAYDGGARLSREVLDLCYIYGFVDICPETAGGLPCPRERHEMQGPRVMSESGVDRTLEFVSGAKKAVEEAVKCFARVAILKAKSPSCGKGLVYDGTFTGRLVPGNGLTSEAFIRNGIKVFTEEETEKARLELESR